VLAGMGSAFGILLASCASSAGELKAEGAFLDFSKLFIFNFSLSEIEKDLLSFSISLLITVLLLII